MRAADTIIAADTLLAAIFLLRYDIDFAAVSLFDIIIMFHAAADGAFLLMRHAQPGEAADAMIY